MRLLLKRSHIVDKSRSPELTARRKNCLTARYRLECLNSSR
ncbi:hypothetical protein CKA32_002171 [Geitlerinema sp. FC II]|nr:hypothetical protein CKA32_002171 [Geitlerinema sp. FC II]